ncbi:MAG: hypothetical protein H7839_21850 [Magnetococcus sp. YQC-5]
MDTNGIEKSVLTKKQRFWLEHWHVLIQRKSDKLHFQISYYCPFLEVIQEPWVAFF